MLWLVLANSGLIATTINGKINTIAAKTRQPNSFRPPELMSMTAANNISASAACAGRSMFSFAFVMFLRLLLIKGIPVPPLSDTKLGTVSGELALGAGETTSCRGLNGHGYAREDDTTGPPEVGVGAADGGNSGEEGGEQCRVCGFS
ncbi:hypothetical protein V6N11_003872 [Hibiscus sabdariffa]|uniref:Secreted protein n=1 Tax=Hibiscus sabdariffa TaxID=183260 RepID=A0ABR2SFA4_9ROSI